MGRFPEYKRQVSQSALNAPTTVVANASIAPGIAALGQGIGQAGAGIGMMVARREAEDERNQREADALRAQTVLVQAGEIGRKWLEDPKDGILNKTGQAAITESSGIDSFYREQLKELTKDLSPRQRALLEPKIAQELAQFSTIVDRHVSKETKLLDKNTTEALLAGKANDAVAAGVRDDMENFFVSEAAGLGELDSLSERSGDTPEMKLARELEYKSNTRMALIEATLASNPDRAVGLFASFENDLDQAKVKDSKLRERVEAVAVSSSAATMAGNAWNKYGTDIASAAAEIQADETTDPRVKRLAIEGVQARFDDHTKMVRVSDVRQLGIISQSVSRLQGRYTIAQLQNDPEFLKIVGEKEKADAFNIVEAQRRARSGNPGERRAQNELNAALKARFTRMTMEDTQGALAIDTDSWASNADDKTRDEIAIIKAKAKADHDKGLTDTQAEFMKQIDQAIPAGLPREEIEKRKDFAAAWLRQQMNANGGKPITTETTDKFVDKVKKDVEEPGKVWGTNTVSGWDNAMKNGVGDIGVTPKPPVAAPATGDLVRVRLANGMIGRMPRNKVPKGATVLPQ